MGLKLYDETSVQAIADAIRAKNGSSDTYTISEMSTAIEDIPSGGTHTETKTVTFLNTTTPFNVGDDFLSGYGVYPQDSSYALAIAVSDGVGFAARLHNGVVDGYSASCTYSNGVFTFDAAFVLNYMGSSVYSLNCLFNDGEQTTIVNGEILTDNSFTDGFQLFAEGSMSNTTTAGGKVNITWNGGTSIGYCRCGKTAYRNAKKVKVHIDYYGDSYGHQHTNNRNWNFAVFVTDIQLTGAISLTNLINDSHCLDYIECDNNQYYGQMNLDFEIDLSEITDAVYISFQSPGVAIQGLKITVVYEDESDLYKYHWSQDGKICVREGLGEVKWFFTGYTTDSGEDLYPEELAGFFPLGAMQGVAILGPVYSTSDATEQIGWIGFYNRYIRVWSINKGGLITGTFYGVVDAADNNAEQHEVYKDPLDIPDIDISLIEKTITSNGTYSAEDDGYAGYSQVTVNVSGPQIPYDDICVCFHEVYTPALVGKQSMISQWSNGHNIGCSWNGTVDLISAGYSKMHYKAYIGAASYDDTYSQNIRPVIIGVAPTQYRTPQYASPSTVDSLYTDYDMYLSQDYKDVNVEGVIDFSNESGPQYLLIIATGHCFEMLDMWFE